MSTARGLKVIENNVNKNTEYKSDIHRGELMSEQSVVMIRPPFCEYNLA